MDLLKHPLYKPAIDIKILQKIFHILNYKQRYYNKFRNKMDRPPPIKRYPSDSDSNEDPFSYTSQLTESFFPSVPSFKSIVPGQNQAIIDPAGPKRRKITENFQMRSFFPNQQNSLIVAVKDFLKSLETDELLTALSILSTELAIAQEPVLLSIPMSKVLEGLMRCIQFQVSDIIILSLNSIITLLEVAPNYSPVLVSLGILSVLIPKVACISDIDLAEKAIKIIEKISKADPHSVLKEGVLSIVIETLDFYELENQKNIINIAINLLSIFSNHEMPTNHMNPTFFKVLNYISSPLQEKILDFSVILFEKIPLKSNFIQNLADQGFFFSLDVVLTHSNHSKVFSIYKTLANFDSKFLNLIITENTQKIIKKILFSGTSIETFEILQIIKNILENKTFAFENFKDLCV